MKASESTTSQSLQFINSFENDILGIEVCLSLLEKKSYFCLILSDFILKTRLSLSSRNADSIQNEINLLKEKNTSSHSNLSGLISCIVTIYKNEIAFIKQMEDLLKTNLKVELKSGECKKK